MSADRWLVPEPTASIPPAADGLLAGRRTDDRMSSRKPHRIKKSNAKERGRGPFAPVVWRSPLGGGMIAGVTERGRHGPFLSLF
ncbi:unnamed protein product [Spirodela intermedia]|uniref:Uncharacterized protein n=1 Tax=Spirodela intermedia TaxID=51605 RepID=A0A7I8KV11_SPIIN|nr:unnamed protein product [Spirodela intermedia]